jgi:hypothetical protein
MRWFYPDLSGAECWNYCQAMHVQQSKTIRTRPHVYSDLYSGHHRSPGSNREFAFPDFEEEIMEERIKALEQALKEILEAGTQECLREDGEPYPWDAYLLYRTDISHYRKLLENKPIETMKEKKE